MQNETDPLRRISVTNSWAEANLMNTLRQWRTQAEKRGYTRIAELSDYLQADELTHVKLATNWIRKLTEKRPEYRDELLDWSRRPWTCPGFLRQRLEQGRAAEEPHFTFVKGERRTRQSASHISLENENLTMQTSPAHAGCLSHRKEADHVPVSPDISAMVPVRLSGSPFDEMFLDGQPHYGYASATVAQAYVDAVNYYGMDGWYIYGSMPEIAPPDRPGWKTRFEPDPRGRADALPHCRNPLRRLTAKTLYPTDMPEWEVEKPVKDLRQDWPRLQAMMGEDENWHWDNSGGFSDRERIGELGVYSVAIGIPQDWWFFQRDGGYNVMLLDFADEESYMQRDLRVLYPLCAGPLGSRLAAKPDEIMLGGSASSLSASSPRNFRKFDLPFIQEAARICREAGVYSHLHVCGRSRKVVEMVAEETDVDVMEPLEEPPGGDVDIAEIKRRYGSKICLKGNINTFDFMLQCHARPGGGESQTPDRRLRRRRRLRPLDRRPVRPRHPGCQPVQAGRSRPDLREVLIFSCS